MTAPARIAVPLVRSVSVRVAEIVEEAREAVTLRLDPGATALPYRPGQLLAIDPHQFDELGGELAARERRTGLRVQSRAYALASAPHERHLAITVVDDRRRPLLSRFLVRELTPGRRMTVIGCTGGYTLPDDLDDRAAHVVHVCAGAGIIPSFSMIKHALHLGLRARHTLIYAGERPVYRDRLEALARWRPEQLSVVYARGGAVDAALLASHIAEVEPVEAFVCGTRSWRLAGIENALRAVGVPRGQIHMEEYR